MDVNFSFQDVFPAFSTFSQIEKLGTEILCPWESAGLDYGEWASVETSASHRLGAAEERRSGPARLLVVGWRGRPA